MAEVPNNNNFTLNQASVDGSLSKIPGFENIATGADSISCALTCLVKAIFIESGLEENQSNLDKIVGGIAPTLDGSAELNKNVETHLDAGWKATGKSGIWAGAWISPGHEQIEKGYFTNLYSIHQVPTRFSNLGGSHYIMQVHGQSNFYDPRTGGYINNYTGVLGYTGARVKSYCTAF